MLAAIAAIRTRLNYFLDKAIQRAARSEVAGAAITTAASRPSASGRTSALNGTPPREEAPQAGEPAAT